MELGNKPLTTPERIEFRGDWAFFGGRKYHHKDIAMIADMRRAGIVSNTHQLAGAELEAFVVSCLKTPDYQVFGMPV